MVKYNESTIYKLCCKDTNVTEEYIGSTTNFGRRKAHHKSRCNNENKETYNIKVYVCIRENGNFENWDMVEVEKYKALDKQDLHKRERYWVETLKSSLNSYIPTRTIKEYNKDNKDLISTNGKKYYIDNKNEILVKVNEYYKNNKEKINVRQKEYRDENKEKLNIKKGEKIMCDCGIIMTNSHMSRHKKSARHLKLMELVK